MVFHGEPLKDALGEALLDSAKKQGYLAWLSCHNGSQVHAIEGT
jgi:hypothetical protein